MNKTTKTAFWMLAAVLMVAMSAESDPTAEVAGCGPVPPALEKVHSVIHAGGQSAIGDIYFGGHLFYRFVSGDEMREETIYFTVVP